MWRNVIHHYVVAMWIEATFNFVLVVYYYLTRQISLGFLFLRKTWMLLDYKRLETIGSNIKPCRITNLNEPQNLSNCAYIQVSNQDINKAFLHRYVILFVYKQSFLLLFLPGWRKVTPPLMLFTGQHISSQLCDLSSNKAKVFGAPNGQAFIYHLLKLLQTAVGKEQESHVCLHQISSEALRTRTDRATLNRIASSHSKSNKWRRKKQTDLHDKHLSSSSETDLHWANWQNLWPLFL